MVLPDVLYVPNLRCYLISISKLVNKGFTISFASEVIIKRNNLFICSGVETNGLYVITPISSNKCDMELNNSVVTVPSKRNEPSSNPTILWHRRLGHINLNRINRLVKDGILNSLVIEPMLVCESCIEDKMTKRPFPPKGNRSNELLKLVHTDVCGPINIRAHSGYEYFITFTDDHSRYEYVYLMHHKSDSFEKFKEYRTKVENQLGKPIKAI